MTEESQWLTDKWWLSPYNYADEVRQQFKLPSRVYIHDVTLREAMQSPRVCLRPEEKIRIAKALDKLGVDSIENGAYMSEAEKEEYQEIVKTAAKLMNEKYPDRSFKITKLKEIYTQVVAGTNYKLICDYEDNEGKGEKEIVVYKDLQGKFSIYVDQNVNAPDRVVSPDSSEELVGGFTKQDPEKEEYQNIAKTAEKLMT